MAYTISQFAKMTGLSVYTIRYYDKEGLLPSVRRDEHGARVFTEEDLSWTELITCLKDTGMSLRSIRTFVRLCVEGDGTLETRLRLMQQHQAEFETKMEQMRHYQRKIRQKVDYYAAAVAAKKEKEEGSGPS